MNPPDMTSISQIQQSKNLQIFNTDSTFHNLTVHNCYTKGMGRLKTMCCSANKSTVIKVYGPPEAVETYLQCHLVSWNCYLYVSCRCWDRLGTHCFHLLGCVD